VALMKVGWFKVHLRKEQDAEIAFKAKHVASVKNHHGNALIVTTAGQVAECTETYEEVLNMVFREEERRR
jgi:hypothetical protein